MTTPLLLIRHAQAEPVSNTGRDADRPLSKRGQREADAIRAWLHPRLDDQKLADWVILHSPSMRTTQTMQRITRGWHDVLVSVDSRIWNASVTQLLQILREHSHRDCPLVLIGHNPGLEQLAYYLIGQLLPMGTGSTVWLEWHPDKETAKVTDQFQPAID